MKLFWNKHTAFFVANFVIASFFIFSLASQSSTSANIVDTSTLGVADIANPVYKNSLLQQTVDGINKKRESFGLTKLPQNPELDKIAQLRAQEMSALGYYAHESPDGKIFGDIMNSRQVRYTYACENLNTSNLPTPKNYIDSWLKSPDGHRECMLGNTHTKAGYALATIKTVNGRYFNQKVIVAIYSN